MKRAVKFNSFQELKSTDKDQSDISVRVQKHLEFERFIKELQAKKRHVDDQRHRK